MSSAHHRAAVGKHGKGYKDPLSRFAYGIDFVTPKAIGGFQIYGNNNNDGRLFRDPTNVSAGFAPSSSGTLTAINSAGLKRTDRGHWNYPTSTALALWNRDLTNAAWVKTNVTATKNQTGADGAANAASSITASATNGTIFQTVTMAVNTVVYSVDIKRLVGTGAISMTVDGGTTYTDITSQVTSSYGLVFITQASVTNPVIGFKIAVSGDSFAVDFNMLINPANSINLPSQYRATTTSATFFSSQSRPSADSTDISPASLWTPSQGFFAFYWQGRSERATGGFIITGSVGIFCSVGASGQVTFTAGSGTANTANSVWRTGLTNVNKVAGYFSPGGFIKIACNGSLGSSTGATVSAPAHYDLGTNGAGQNSIYGINEKFYISPNLTLGDGDLISMTT